jgi:hypothetical protein
VDNIGLEMFYEMEQTMALAFCQQGVSKEWSSLLDLLFFSFAL